MRWRNSLLRVRYNLSCLDTINSVNLQSWIGSTRYPFWLIPTDLIINVMEVHNEPLKKIIIGILPRRNSVRWNDHHRIGRR